MLSRLANKSISFSTQQVIRSNARFLSHHKEKPFDKILIANRGEIACRVIRTARRLGVKTVAVYSEADAAAMHVRMADEAYCIGPAQSKDSYLKMERILDVCKKTGAQGIHPGYGFLSENSKFVDMVEAAGIVFIGPPSGPMNAMGDKINSKKIVKNAGCFVIPGFEGEVENEDVAVKLANEVGYPVMIKASAGGGGKGMRVAYNDAEVRDGFRLSKAEALSSFGDDRMLIERFIENPHHIEIQVLADTHGNVVAFPERECSVQRRNQKVVEESPSPYLSAETRKAMQLQAIQLCKAVGYRSAGTVEMLADDKQNFYFLEMNTRLQVEHPITEMVSGEDLVEHMLWIGAGKPLPDRLAKNPTLTFNGHAIESRVYAEDPKRKFLPSIGPLITYKEPQVYSTPERTVRIDTGVFEGGVISMYYDPMIAKLCTHAKTRSEAIKLQEDALDQYVVQGLNNNISFLRSIYRNKNFRDGNYCTKFIGEEYPKGFTNVELTPRERLEMIAATVALDQAKHSNEFATNPRLKAFRDDIDEHADTSVVAVLDGKAYSVSSSFENNMKVSITPLDDHNKPIRAEHSEFTLTDLEWNAERPLAKLTLEDRPNHETERFIQYVGRTPDGYQIRYLGADHSISIRSVREHQLSQYMLKPEVKDLANFVLSPMPGTLISCSVKPGQHVEAGQQLIVLEAMKMQNILRAERSGTIKSIKKDVGSPVKVDEVLIEFA